MLLAQEEQCCYRNNSTGESGADSDDGDDGGGAHATRGRRKRKARTRTNVRPRETVLLVLACLLSGQNYSGYLKLNGLPHYLVK